VINILVNTGSLSAGEEIRVYLQRYWIPCPSLNQTVATWDVRQAASSITPLPLASQPSQNFVAGPAKMINYYPWDNLNVMANTASIPIHPGGQRTVVTRWSMFLRRSSLLCRA